MGSKWIEFLGKNVPSSKNSKMLTGKRIIKSKLCQEYEKWSEHLFEKNREEWQRQLQEHKERPIFVGFYFFRDSRRKWDFTNIVQLPADLMQKHNYLENDDTTNFIPVYMGEELSKKENSGFKMKILNDSQLQTTQV